MSDSAKLFVTDYASYNEGSQFEFADWWDLDDYSDEDEFMDAIIEHLQECDKKRPLENGAPREEIMFTDYEGFPDRLYHECMGRQYLKSIFDFMQLDEHEKLKYAFVIDNDGGSDHSYIMDHIENVDIILADELEETFDEIFPEVLAASEKSDYLTIDYDSYRDMEWTDFNYEGTRYLGRLNY